MFNALKRIWNRSKTKARQTVDLPLQKNICSKIEISFDALMIGVFEL